MITYPILASLYNSSVTVKYVGAMFDVLQNISPVAYHSSEYQRIIWDIMMWSQTV